MNTTLKNVSYSVLMLVGALSARTAEAFSEDLCVFPMSSGGFTVKNCLDARACNPKEGDTRACHANVVWEMGKATVGTNVAASRSMLHTDATYYLAQKAGFTPEAAWWIAAYDQATDLGAYSPFDASGQVLNSWKGLPVSTAAINGFERTSFATAGTLLHVHAPTYRGNDVGYSSMVPDLTDEAHESFLRQLRSWAFTDSDLCVGGFRAGSADASGEESSGCFGQDERVTTTPSELPYHLYLLQPLFANGSSRSPVVSAGALGGEQIAAYTPSSSSNGPKNIADVSLASDMEPLLEAAYTPEAWESLQNTAAGQDMALLARTGIYLHSLQDRISHHACSDASVSTHEASPRLNEGVYVTRYEASACSQAEHAFGHYEEVGQGKASVPERTLSALSLTYQELRALATGLPKRSGLLTSRALAASDTLSSRDLSLLGRALATSGACQRVAAFLRLEETAGFAHMPGYDAGQASTLCR